MRTAVLLASALGGLVGATAARARVFDLDTDRVPVVELKGLWRFHTGDDPNGKLGWASPEFDDAKWKLIRSDLPWDEQGYKGYTGFAWYRVQVKLPQKRIPLAIGIPHISTSYQVFADGRLIGQFGGIPPHPKIETEPPQIFFLPDEAAAPLKPIMLAIRVWYLPLWDAHDGGGLSVAPLFGNAEMVASWRDYQMKTIFWTSAATSFHLPFELFGAVAGLALFLIRRADREYLWFATYQIFGALSDASSVFTSFRSQSMVAYDVFSSVAVFGWYVSLLLLVSSLLKRRIDSLFWAATGLAFSRYLIAAIPFHAGWLGGPSQLTMDLGLALPLYAFVILLLYRGARRGNRDALLLLFPFSFNFLAWVVGEALQAYFAAGHTDIAPLLLRFFHLYDWPFPFGVWDVAGFLCDFSTLAVLVARFARSRHEELRMAAEFEAARTVQQVLVPEEIPSIPALAIECVYRPAGQVGGDFFQVLPTSEGGALFVIGDVSGKGMPAAMAVSLLVGTVRTLAHYTQSPSEILTAMNRRMLARSKDGFTTCLVLRLQADGTLTAANAGHLAPYLGNQELVVEGSLPLGLSPQVTYAESSVQFEVGEQLTLLTDGVVEARARNGELFGFERTASVAGRSAEYIAQTALAFGQQDDVTVLTVRRQRVAEVNPIEPTAPLLTPSAVRPR
jgi:hypothetical protein